MSSFELLVPLICMTPDAIAKEPAKNDGKAAAPAAEKAWDGSLSADEIAAEAALQKNYNEKGVRPQADGASSK